MASEKTFDEHYKNQTHQELLKLRSEGGLIAEAEQALDKELARRNISPDEMRRYVPPQWLDKVEVGAVGVLTLVNGKNITAEIVGLNEESDQLLVNVSHRNSHRHDRAIPVYQVTSFEPQPHFAQQWPFSDPCRGRSSRARLFLMSTIFLCLIVGSLPLFFILTKGPYGLQEASVISFTLFGVFFTFARTGTRSGHDLPPFKFTCPAVRPQIPHLLWRHFCFLIVLFALQTAMLAARTRLPEWWNIKDRKGSSPFDLVLLLLCFGLAWAEVVSSRSLLERAHRKFTG